MWTGKSKEERMEYTIKKFYNVQGNISNLLWNILSKNNPNIDVRGVNKGFWSLHGSTQFQGMKSQLLHSSTFKKPLQCPTQLCYWLLWVNVYVCNISKQNFFRNIVKQYWRVSVGTMARLYCHCTRSAL